MAALFVRFRKRLGGTDRSQIATAVVPARRDRDDNRNQGGDAKQQRPQAERLGLRRVLRSRSCSDGRSRGGCHRSGNVARRGQSRGGANCRARLLCSKDAQRNKRIDARVGRRCWCGVGCLCRKQSCCPCSQRITADCPGHPELPVLPEWRLMPPKWTERKAEMTSTKLIFLIEAVEPVLLKPDWACGARRSRKRKAIHAQEKCRSLLALNHRGYWEMFLVYGIGEQPARPRLRHVRQAGASSRARRIGVVNKGSNGQLPGCW